MKSIFYIFCILSINCNAQGNKSDSLSLGECWNIQYQNINDLGLKKYEIGISYHYCPIKIEIEQFAS